MTTSTNAPGALTLVVLAAGLGSRFGGSKQTTAVDQAGHTLLDYAIFDAVRAGFERAVLVVAPGQADSFRAGPGRRLSEHIAVVYVEQTLTDLPAGATAPAGRTKPWGTAHAVWAARHAVQGPFATVNADDFYGATAMSLAAGFLQTQATPSHHLLVGYRLGNTLSPNGPVSRGVCQLDAAGHLAQITEHTQIEAGPDGPLSYGWVDPASASAAPATSASSAGPPTATPLPADTIVSMNLWGFHPGIFDSLESHLAGFFTHQVPANPLKAECYLPSLPQAQLTAGQATVTVLASPDQWYGMTYAQDLPQVTAALSQLRQAGAYPDLLWGAA
ncbi:MAG: NTP transferase domain-containing protein [Bifidobacteriaceae bacterium]|jgi:NDP-sugar pyrophosphorylase family protein|nr:NTP transferase domain-containing protein [Bifidobacteriaceae bacterium]